MSGPGHRCAALLRASGTLVLMLLLAASASGSDSVRLLRSASEPAVPGNPLEPPGAEVRCRCAGYPNQTLCMWSEPSGQSTPMRYIATYRETDESSVKHCHLFPPGSSSSALSPSSSPSSSSSSEKLWLCQLDHLKLYTNYILNVTSISPLGNITRLTSFMVEDLVKPDPPVELRVSQKVRKLVVDWSPPPTWSNLDVFPLKYQLRLSWSHRGDNHTVSPGPYEDTKVTMPGLAPGRTYVLQVCAMELLGLGECSDWSLPVKVLTDK